MFRQYNHCYITGGTNGMTSDRTGDTQMSLNHFASLVTLGSYFGQFWDVVNRHLAVFNDYVCKWGEKVNRTGIDSAVILAF